MASSFKTPLVVEFDYEGDPKKPFVLVQPFEYQLDHLGSADWVYVPVGFRTDFASIPKPFRNIFSPTGPYGKAAVVHDYLYNEGYVSRLMGDADGEFEYAVHQDITRKQADDIFLEAMKVLGVGYWTRTIVYLAVRVGGRGNF